MPPNSWRPNPLILIACKMRQIKRQLHLGLGDESKEVLDDESDGVSGDESDEEPTQVTNWNWGEARPEQPPKWPTTPTAATEDAQEEEASVKCAPMGLGPYSSWDDFEAALETYSAETYQLYRYVILLYMFFLQ